MSPLSFPSFGNLGRQGSWNRRREWLGGREADDLNDNHAGSTCGNLRFSLYLSFHPSGVHTVHNAIKNWLEEEMVASIAILRRRPD